MPRVPVEFPFGGRSDRMAHHRQPEKTTRDARNVRSRDPVTGRVRGAQRSGFSKLFASQINSSGRGHDMCSFSYDSGTTEYARKASGSPTSEWLKELPDASDTEHGLDVDRQSNVYVTYKTSGVAKYNSAGELQWKLAIPVEDSDHVVKTLHVDIVDRVYVGVTHGGEQEDAMLWAYEQVEDEDENQSREVLWKIQTGFFFEELYVLGDRLYTLQNDVENVKAYVIVYRAIDSTTPFEEQRTQVLFPARGLSVATDGSFYVAAPEDTSAAVAAQTEMYVRSVSSKFSSFRPSVTGTKLEELIDDYEDRVWSHYDATRITFLHMAEAVLEENARISILPDISGKGRNMFAADGTTPGSPDFGPLWTEREVNGMPSLHFVGDEGLILQPAVYPRTANRKSQRSMWPGYRDTQSEAGTFVTFIVLKIPPDDSGRRVVLSQQDSNGNHRRLWANSNSAGADVLGNIFWDPGFIFSNDPGGGTGSPGKPLHYDYSSASGGTDCCLITIIDECGVYGNLVATNTSQTRSLLRVNGNPVDRWSNNYLLSYFGYPSAIGWDPIQGSSSATRFIGDFCEMLTLDRIDPMSASEELVIEHERHDPPATTGPTGDQTENEMTKIEGFLMHKWGIPHIAPDDGDTYPHPFGNVTSGSIKVSGAPGATTAQRESILNFPCTAKYDRSGELKWIYNSNTSNEAAADLGGVGLGVRSQEFPDDEDDNDVHVYSIGETQHAHESSGQVGLRKIIDQGDTFSDALTDTAWRHKFQGNNDPVGRLRMDVDEFGRLYVPYNVPSSTDDHALEVFEKDGDVSGDGQLITFYQGAYTGQTGSSAHHDVDIPDYGEGQTIDLAEFAFLAVSTTTSDPEGLVRLGLVTATQTTGNPRQIVHLVAASGDIKTFTTGGTVTTPTGGSGALDSTSPFVMCIPMLGEAVFLDGLAYKVYVARKNEVEDLEAKSSGAIVKRGRIGAFWRNRLVIGHFPENPGGWAMSAMGDIRDWDFFPPVVKSTSAALGNLARAKETPDILTGIIPMSDDLLLMGGYRSIWRMTGDPQDGGQMDRLSDSIGMAFGKAWAKDPEGRTFFFGLNPPGLYSIDVSGQVVNLTKSTLEDSEFATIDFGAKNIRLFWDPIERGIHIYQMPRTTLGALVNHWFWEEKTADMVQMPPIWTDTFLASSVQPMAATALEGDDATGRQFVVLGEDGYIRKVDSSVADDDGTAIDAYFVTHLFGQEAGVEMMLVEIRINLGQQQDGADLELFANSDSAFIGPILQSVTLIGGANDSFRGRVRGENIWARIRNSRSDERFAYSSGWAEFVGPQRQRR